MLQYLLLVRLGEGIDVSCIAGPVLDGLGLDWKTECTLYESHKKRK